MTYWACWHLFIYHIFKFSYSEYYPRVQLNLRCFKSLRFWPQLASAFGYMWPFLILYRRRICDVQLRAWLLCLPVWYAFMFEWGILTETRIFGELIAYLAPMCVLMGEEAIAARLTAGHPPGAALSTAPRGKRAA